jgi:anti-anti-sigma factor
MEINLDKQNNIIKPLGRLDANSSVAFEKAIEAFSDYKQDLILDMSACPYLSSAGIRVLLIAKKKLQSHDREMYVTDLEPAVLQVLQMAGLHQLLRIVPTVDHALALQKLSESQGTTSHQFAIGTQQFDFQLLHHEKIKASYWVEPTILSFDELCFGIGLGSINTPVASAEDDSGLVVVTPYCTGFLPDKHAYGADFRITTEPKKTGLCITEALSFGKQASGAISCAKDASVHMNQLLPEINEILHKTGHADSVNLFVVLNQSREAPSISFVICNSLAMKDKLAAIGLHDMKALISKQDGDVHFYGIGFLLAELEFAGKLQALPELLEQHLGFENIIGVQAYDENTLLQNPVLWLFQAQELVEGQHQLLSIETNAIDFAAEKAFLARQLYTDSSKLVIDQLHGGFSAQTFHVKSYDHEGRKMRPTVLKIAPRNLIERESAGCQHYALPYIFNNSAVVLGTAYYGDMGALRYNFVGIGGEESRLQWLTKYYEQMNQEYLEPLLDKIFLQILKPWYGQTVMKELQLFDEHDPTRTFFPHIFEVVQEVWGISADDAQLMINGKQYLNPYWYLKHKYAKYRNYTYNYPTAVCHGDLNMQNILLDDAMNIYLIDFSETRPRAAISDFARLEAIMTIDRAAVETEQDWQAYADFLETFYQAKTLDTLPEANFEGHDGRSINKQVFVTHKMRQYARQTVAGRSEIFPYYLALLEWVLPVICYTLPMPQRKISTVAASLLCQNLIELGFD